MLSGTLILGMVTLEGQKYVTVSLVILMVECIHKELHETHDRLQELVSCNVFLKQFSKTWTVGGETDQTSINSLQGIGHQQQEQPM